MPPAFDWPLIGAHPTSPLQWLALVGLGVGITGYQYGNTLKHKQAAREAGDGSYRAEEEPDEYDNEPTEPMVMRTCSPAC